MDGNIKAAALIAVAFNRIAGLTERNALATASGDAVPDRVIHSLEELFGLPEFAGS